MYSPSVLPVTGIPLTVNTHLRYDYVYIHENEHLCKILKARKTTNEDREQRPSKLEEYL